MVTTAVTTVAVRGSMLHARLECSTKGDFERALTRNGAVLPYLQSFRFKIEISLRHVHVYVDIMLMGYFPTAQFTECLQALLINCCTEMLRVHALAW